MQAVSWRRKPAVVKNVIFVMFKALQETAGCRRWKNMMNESKVTINDWTFIMVLPLHFIWKDTNKSRSTTPDRPHDLKYHQVYFFCVWVTKVVVSSRCRPLSEECNRILSCFIWVMASNVLLCATAVILTCITWSFKAVCNYDIDIKSNLWNKIVNVKNRWSTD